MVDVAASKVAEPDGAKATPSDFSAPAVPASMATDVPTPDRLGMAVTVSALLAAVFDAALSELSLPHAAVMRANAPIATAPDFFHLVARAMDLFSRGEVRRSVWPFYDTAAPVGWRRRLQSAPP